VPGSCTKVEVLGVGQCNGITQTGPQPTPVTVVTKFSHVDTKVRRLENSGGRPSRWVLSRFLVTVVFIVILR